MADHTSIEWTDATLNVVNGCSVVSPGCANCYAMRAGARNLPGHPSTGLTQPSKAGHVWTGEVRFNEKALLLPLRWRRPRRIFWNAHGDLFHDSVPDQWIDRCFAVMALTPQHQHQVLTKRSARMRAYLVGVLDSPERRTIIYAAGARMLRDDDAKRREVPPRFPLPNVWLGVSVEDQTRADERIPDLLATPAAVRFISAEPLLGPINLTEVSDCATALDPECWGDCRCDALYGFDAGCRRNGGDGILTRKIDWVIVGGESGPGARPMHPDWVVSLHDQCAATGTAFLFKQWGEFLPDQVNCAQPRSINLAPDHVIYNRVGKKAAGRKLFGVTHDGMPGA